MERKGEDFLALQEYVMAKATLLERLANMEEKRDKIKKVIFDKIRADYEGQLRKLIDDFRSIRIRITQKLGEFEQELAQVEKKLTFAQDKVIELRFRHQLGEYVEDEFRRMEFEALALVDNIQAQWDDLNADLEDYRTLIGDDKDFQRRYSFQEEPEPEPIEESYEEPVAAAVEEEPFAASAEATDMYQYEAPSVEEPEIPGAAEPVAPVAREPAGAPRRDARVPAYLQEPAEYEPESDEDGTMTTQDAALMDDEDLFRQYYQEPSDPETVEIGALGAFDETATEDSGTLEIPAGFAPSSYSTDDSSTGIWSGDALLGVTQPMAVPPPAVPPGPVKAATSPAGKKPGPALKWTDDDDDKDSTMVWGATPVIPDVAPVAPPPPPPPPKVLVFKDRKNNREVAYPLGKGEVSIGRSQENDIVLTEGKISRRHAKVHLSESGFVLSDLNSSNGTFVNGKKIARPVVLRENDEILIGDSSMTFR